MLYFLRSVFSLFLSALVLLFSTSALAQYLSIAELESAYELNQNSRSFFAQRYEILFKKDLYHKTNTIVFDGLAQDKNTMFITLFSNELCKITHRTTFINRTAILHKGDTLKIKRASLHANRSLYYNERMKRLRTNFLQLDLDEDIEVTCEMSKNKELNAQREDANIFEVLKAFGLDEILEMNVPASEVETITLMDLEKESLSLEVQRALLITGEIDTTDYADSEKRFYFKINEACNIQTENVPSTLRHAALQSQTEYSIDSIYFNLREIREFSSKEYRFVGTGKSYVNFNLSNKKMLFPNLSLNCKVEMAMAKKETPLKDFMQSSGLNGWVQFKK